MTTSPHTGLSADEVEQLNALFDLARDGDLRLMDYVGAGVPVNLTNHSGDTLLILAAYHRHAELVACGADAERVNDRGQTALGCAVFRHDAVPVKLLLQAGADRDGGGASARHISQLFALDDMAALLGEASRCENLTMVWGCFNARRSGTVPRPGGVAGAARAPATGTGALARATGPGQEAGPVATGLARGFESWC